MRPVDLHVEAVRSPSQSYPASRFADPVSHLGDEERRAAFEAEAVHFETRYFATFTFLPPEDAIGKAESLLVENLPQGRGGPRSVEFQLVDDAPLDPRFFTHEFHHGADRAVIEED